MSHFQIELQYGIGRSLREGKSYTHSHAGQLLVPFEMFNSEIS
jgi:hypothetical protein